IRDKLVTGVQTCALPICAYLPLEVSEKQEHVCAFARHLPDNQPQRYSTMITVIPRFSYTLMRGKIEAPLGEVWEQAELTIPENFPQSFENLFTGEKLNRGEKG